MRGYANAVVFWAADDPSEIADRLEGHGVTVDRVGVSLREAGGIHP